MRFNCHSALMSGAVRKIHLDDRVIFSMSKFKLFWASGFCEMRINCLPCFNTSLNIFALPVTLVIIIPTSQNLLSDFNPFGGWKNKACLTVGYVQIFCVFFLFGFMRTLLVVVCFCEGFSWLGFVFITSQAVNWFGRITSFSGLKCVWCQC